MNIVLCYPVERRHLEQIESVVVNAGQTAAIIDAGQDDVPERIMDADIFCGHAKKRPIDWQQVVQKNRLRWIQSSAAGIDHCLTQPVIESDILVTSASGLFANQVAEQTMALLMGLLRSMPVFFRAAERREFVRRPTHDLHGLRVGILGFGGNGRRMGELLAPWNTRIWATDYFPVDCPAHIERLLPPEQTDEVLEFAQVLILCVPLTEQTAGMIDRQAIERMPRGAWLINVARGPVVRESALIDALRSGQLAGAGLDVTEIEPLPAESPLWEMENVLISPHVGAQSHRRFDDATDLFCDNLGRYLRHDRLLHTVDKRLGFPRRE